jgi:hypothetical protein
MPKLSSVDALFTRIRHDRLHLGARTECPDALWDRRLVVGNPMVRGAARVQAENATIGTVTTSRDRVGEDHGGMSDSASPAT